MGKVVVIRDSEHDWQDPPDEWEGKAKAGEPGVRFKSLLPLAGGMPNMQRSRYEPFHHEPPHDHPEDEVIFVLDGSIFFGSEELRFGDAIFVPSHTTYSLRTEATGAEFLRVGLFDLAPPQA